ncbi:MAG: DUF4252 domain-containing protein [Cyclobacteriaceae bacterium]
MKKTIVAIALMIVSLGAMAQSPIITKYMDKYESNEDFAKVSLNGRMFSLFANFEGGTEEEKEFMEAVSKIKGLKVLLGEKVENSAKLFKEVTSEVDKAGYDELMTVKDAEEDMKFSIREKNGIIEELIMVVGGNKSFVLLSLYGEIDLKSISKFASKMDVGGLGNLSKLSEENGN